MSLPLRSCGQALFGRRPGSSFVGYFSSSSSSSLFGGGGGNPTATKSSVPSFSPSSPPSTSTSFRSCPVARAAPLLRCSVKRRRWARSALGGGGASSTSWRHHSNRSAAGAEAPPCPASLRVWEVPAGGGAGTSEGGDDGEETATACYDGRDDESAGGESGSGWIEVRCPPIDQVRRRRDEDAFSSAVPPLGDRIEKSLRRNVLRHFLPEGYPSSVSPSYLPYAAHCFLASSCGSAAFVLSTQALLLAVGVGSSEAAPVAAALNWVLKDGVGQLGGVLFASRLGSGGVGGGRGHGGSTIDSDPKRWRMVAALALDSATFLEILCPLFPGYFLPIASVANVGKNIGFLAAGASRAAIHQSLARSSNLGDVTAKAGSQSIAASLTGTGMGLVLSPLVGGDVTKVASGFAALSACHQFCNYRALRSVALDSLNRHRLNLVLDRYVRDANISANASGVECDAAGADLARIVPSPAEVAEQESFLPFLRPDDSGSWLLVGCGVRELSPRGPDQLRRLTQICSICEEEEEELKGRSWRYVLNCDADDAGDTARAIRLVFLEGADGRDILRGMLHAHVLRKTTPKDLEAFLEGNRGSASKGFDRAEIIISASRVMSSKYTRGLLRGLEERGWRVTDGSMCIEGGAAGRRLRIDT